MAARPESLEQLIWELRRVFRELTVAANQELQSLGVQASDRAFLEFLARETDPVSLSALARKYAVSRQHIQQTWKRLSRPAWIEEVPNPSDKRTVLLRLSREGREIWKKIRRVDRAFLDRLARPLSGDRVTDATELLRQLRVELHKRKEDEDEQQQ